ncbi:MAG: hypothetical protein J0L92_21420 [Deltaproteobacteria bacterium]|nr:hypothetical protein [Deltaproteobacteria bacterium]
MRPLAPFLSMIVLVCALGSSTLAQSRPAFFDQPSVIERVGTITEGQRVPLIVLLPPTGGDARWVTPPPGIGPCVLLITPGQPARSDYLPAFSRYLDWVEARVMADVERAIAEQPIDPDRIYLAGFSLGGDVGWGLLTRHPERFRGAVVMGSRSSARPRSSAIETMRSRGVRVAFVMGSADDATRRTGAQRAYESLVRSRITTQRFEHAGAHEMPPRELYARALTFVME